MSRSSWNIPVVPKSKLTSFLIRDTQNIDTQKRGDGYMKRETKKCPQSPEAGKGGEWFSPLKPLERVWPCCCLDFRCLASRTAKKYISVVASFPMEGEGHSELGNRRHTRNMTAASQINSPRLHMLHPLLRPSLLNLVIWLFPSFPSKLYLNSGFLEIMCFFHKFSYLFTKAFQRF